MPRVESHYGAYIVYGRGYGPEGMLVQTDYDYPATAQSLGWNMRRVQWSEHPGEARHLRRAPNRGSGCDHRGTDGTINCPDCGMTATAFIAAAAEYLDSIAM
jgi:hypothetical protein